MVGRSGRTLSDAALAAVRDLVFTIGLPLDKLDDAMKFLRIESWQKVR